MTTKALGHLKKTGGSKTDRSPKKHMVTLIPGDTIGEELADAVAQVVDATGVSLGWERCVSGQRALAKHGTPLPEEMFESIRKNKVALATYKAFSPSKQRDYVEWITEAKRETTRAKRLVQAVEWLTQGKSRNWKYENC